VINYNIKKDLCEINNGQYRFTMKVVVPVTSLCPCSKKISDYGAHNQRSHVTITARIMASPVTTPVGCLRHRHPAALTESPMSLFHSLLLSLLLLPAFGAGLTWCAHLVRWGERVTPKGTSDAELPPCDKSALEMVLGFRARKAAHAATQPG
jgi:hypothetical protein